MKETNSEKTITFTFNLIAMVLLVMASVQYFYTEHPYMSAGAFIASFIMGAVVFINFKRALK